MKYSIPKTDLKIITGTGQSSMLFHQSIEDSAMSPDLKSAFHYLYEKGLGRNEKLPRKLKKRLLGSK